MNASQRRKYGRKVERINRRLENVWLPKIIKVIQLKANIVISRLKNGGTNSAFQYLSSDLGNPILSGKIKQLYTQVGLIHAKRINDELRAEPRIMKSIVNLFLTKRIGFNSTWIQFVNDYLEKFLLQKITFEVNETTRDALLRAVQKGISDGLGVDDIIRILERWPYARLQAARIVRTEINRAANVGAMAGGSTFKFEQQKEWIAAMDNRTRGTDPKDHANHRELDGNIVNEAAVFIDVRNGDQLQFPGDPSASAASTINCFLPKELVDIDLRFIKKAFRSIYKGKVITIKTASGNSFTCTPNHPILTLRGWIKAGQLTSIDNLVKSSFINNKSTRIYSYINDVPTTFEKVFSSLNKAFTTVRKLPTSMDFYGDVPTSHIDIIDTESKLPNGGKHIIFKLAHDNIFTSANFRSSFLFSYSSFAMAFYEKFSRKITDSLIGVRYKILSFFKWSLCHSQIHRFAACSPFNPSFIKPDHNRSSAYSQIKGNSFYAQSFIEQRNDGLNTNINSFNNTFFDPVSAKDFVDYGSATADSITDLIRRKPGFVKTDNVCSVVVHEYDGYVFTLETNNQMYDINGYIARNCRCSVALTAKRDERGRLIPKKSRISVIMPTTNIRRIITI